MKQNVESILRHKIKDGHKATVEEIIEFVLDEIRNPERDGWTIEKVSIFMEGRDKDGARCFAHRYSGISALEAIGLIFLGLNQVLGRTTYDEQ